MLVVNNEVGFDIIVEVGKAVDIGRSEFVLVVLVSWLMGTACIVLVTMTVSMTRSVLGGDVTYTVRNHVFWGSVFTTVTVTGFPGPQPGPEPAPDPPESPGPPDPPKPGPPMGTTE